MANVLKMEKQIAVISGLAEGLSIRSIERMTGVNRNTIMSLNLRVGHGCARVMDSMMRGLNSKTIQMDEIWGFVAKKQRKVTIDDSLEVGDVWTFIAVDADSKIVPCYRIGKRDLPNATAFVSDLASRLNNRIQLSSDSLNSYPQAVERAFGCEVDYGQLIKVYATTSDVGPQARYSPGEVNRHRKDSHHGLSGRSEDFNKTTSSHRI